MVLRRLSSAVQNQNWTTLVVETFVVVIGIFLAFQVDRWYADQRARTDAQERIDALIEDFVNNREELEFQVARRQTTLDAAAGLLKLDEQDPTVEDFDRFYRLLAQTSRGSSTRFRRGSYDVLISTGEIDLITDKGLHRDIAAFFALLDELISVNERSAERRMNLFEPYVAYNLDHVQMLEHMHPPNESNGIGQDRPTQEKEQFLEVLGTVAFEGVVAAMWHAARDELRQLEELGSSMESIQSRLHQFASSPKKAN